MKKDQILLLIAIALTCAICGYMIIDADQKAMKRIADESDKRSSYIGKKVIIDNDTLTVINYNGWRNNYILSNGKEVDYNYVWNTSK